MANISVTPVKTTYILIHFRNDILQLILSTDDPLGKLKFCLTIHGFENKWKKYFWHCAALLKLLILICRTIYAFQNLDQPKKLVELVATYPVRLSVMFNSIKFYKIYCV